MSNYEPEFKNKIIYLHLEDGRTIKSLQEEYSVSKASISIWIKEFRDTEKTSKVVSCLCFC